MERKSYEERKREKLETAVVGSFPTSAMKTKIVVVFLALLVAASYLVYVLYDIMFIRGDYFRAKASALQISVSEIKAGRGTIYDSTGKIIAYSERVWTVVVSPSSIAGDEEYSLRRYNKEKSRYDLAQKNEEEYPEPDKNKVYNEAEEIAEGISKILGLDRDEIYEKCKKKTTIKNEDGTTREGWVGEVTIVTKIEKDVYEELCDFKSYNAIGDLALYFKADSKRIYPQNSLAAQVIGFTDYEGSGAYGLEAYYDPYLKGVDGREERVTSLHGEILPGAQGSFFDAKQGNDVTLTLNSDLQSSLEYYLEETVIKKQAANRATGIIMNAKTGAILAMATAPSFDLNNRNELADWYQVRYDKKRNAKLSELLEKEGKYSGTAEDLNEEDKEEFISYTQKILSEEQEFQWKNKAVSELYSPGSVFKTVMTAAGLEEGTISEGSSFSCNGSLVVGGASIKCHKPGGHGGQTLAKALLNSCNPAFMNIGLTLGNERFKKYFETFGFTHPTGIDLPAEASPYYHKYLGDMPLPDLARSSFGQVNTCTPIQMLTAFTASVNGGHLLTPYVVDKITDSDGNIIFSGGKDIKRDVISEETSRRMRDLLLNVVDTNGGTNAKIEGYKIGGKSGTTEKYGEYTQDDMRYIGTFAAAVPCGDDPKNTKDTDEIPEITMLVCVDEPMGSEYYGSQLAAPVVQKVFLDCLPSLGIVRDEVAKTITTVPVATNNIVIIGSKPEEAESEFIAAGFKVKVIGDGEKVRSTVPQVGSEIPEGGTIVIYTNDDKTAHAKEVPNVIGKSYEEANDILVSAGFNFSPSGASGNPDATVDEQSVSGVYLPPGTVIGVHFKSHEEG